MRVLVCLLAGVLAGVGAIGLGKAEEQVGPFKLEIATTASSRGRTEVDLGALREALNRATGGILSRLRLDDVVNVPQAGKVSARTHAAPLLVRMRITDVDPERVREILPSGRPSLVELLSPIRTRLTATMTRLAATSVALGAAAGMVLALLFRGRILGVLAGIAGGAGAPAAIFALTAATYDLNAFAGL